MLITVLTINYNNYLGLEKTIKSVLNQTYKNIEFIVIDGASSDKSSSILKKFRDPIDFLISENDTGIYNAMNKGIKKATGDFLIFLNSGDYFYSVNSLTDFMSKIKTAEFAYYGNAIILDPVSNKSFLSPAKQQENYTPSYTFTPNHQAILFPKSFYSNFNYNESYKICSDADYIFKLSTTLPLIHINKTLTIFELGGVSNTFKSFSKTVRHMKESFSVHISHQKYKFFAFIYIPSKFIFKYFLHRLFKK
jgi:glycosyltransferase involved in cell wall biosynthesis